MIINDDDDHCGSFTDPIASIKGFSAKIMMLGFQAVALKKSNGGLTK